MDDNTKIILPPEIFETVPGTARVQFAYFPNSRLFRGTEEIWEDTGPVIGASLGDTKVDELTNCVVYKVPNIEVIGLLLIPRQSKKYTSKCELQVVYFYLNHIWIHIDLTVCLLSVADRGFPVGERRPVGRRGRQPPT